MRNPWTLIPPDDYVGHMSSPEVGQHAVLNRLFGEAVRSAQPREILFLGCSTGNGLEHVDAGVTRRVTCIDINRGYLDLLVGKFPDSGFGLQVRCGDVAEYPLPAATFDLVHAGLLLEYVDWRSLLPRIADALRPGGVLSLVLQRPAENTPAVTPTGFESLRLLESLFQFVDPEALVEHASAAGLALEHRRTEPLPGGKAFEVFRLRKPAVR